MLKQHFVNLPFLLLLLLACFSCQKEKSEKVSQSADRYYGQAEQHLARREYPEAFDAFEQTLRLNPNHSGVYLKFFRGYQAQQRNKYPEATAYCTQFLKRAKETSSDTVSWQKEVVNAATLNLAQSYYDWALLSLAFFNVAVNVELDYYTQKLILIREGKIPPTDEDYLLYFRGLCYYYMKRYAQAIGDFLKISSNSTLFFHLQIALAMCYYKTGEREKARQILESVYEKGKDDAVLLSRLGYAHTELFPQAPNGLDYCRRAKALATQGVLNKVLTHLSYAYAQMNQPSLAYEYFKKLDRKQADAVSNSGSKFFDPLFYKLQANVYFSKALEYYSLLEADKSGNSDDICFQIGTCYLQFGRYDEAISYFEKLVDKESQIRLKAAISLGFCYFKNGNQARAKKYWQLAENSMVGLFEGSIPEQPASTIIQSELGKTFAALNIRLDEAFALCSDAYKRASRGGFEIRPPSVWRKLNHNLAKVAFQRGVKENRIEFVLQSVGLLESLISGYNFTKGSSDYPLVLIDLANAQYYLRNFSEPANIWGHFLDDYPEVEPIFHACQSVLENWRKIQWYKELLPEIQWQEVCEW